jgi:hypothetical protein
VRCPVLALRLRTSRGRTAQPVNEDQTRAYTSFDQSLSSLREISTAITGRPLLTNRPLESHSDISFSWLSEFAIRFWRVEENLRLDIPMLVRVDFYQMKIGVAFDADPTFLNIWSEYGCHQVDLLSPKDIPSYSRPSDTRNQLSSRLEFCKKFSERDDFEEERITQVRYWHAWQPVRPRVERWFESLKGGRPASHLVKLCSSTPDLLKIPQTAAVRALELFDEDEPLFLHRTIIGGNQRFFLFRPKQSSTAAKHQDISWVAQKRGDDLSFVLSGRKADILLLTGERDEGEWDLFRRVPNPNEARPPAKSGLPPNEANSDPTPGYENITSLFQKVGGRPTSISPASGYICFSLTATSDTPSKSVLIRVPHPEDDPNPANLGLYRWEDNVVSVDKEHEEPIRWDTDDQFFFAYSEGKYRTYLFDHQKKAFCSAIASVQNEKDIRNKLPLARGTTWSITEEDDVSESKRASTITQILRVTALQEPKSEGTRQI